MAVPILIEATLAETCGEMTEVSVVTTEALEGMAATGALEGMVATEALEGMVATGDDLVTEGRTGTCHVLAIETSTELTDVRLT